MSERHIVKMIEDGEGTSFITCAIDAMGLSEQLTLERLEDGILTFGRFTPKDETLEEKVFEVYTANTLALNLLEKLDPDSKGPDFVYQRLTEDGQVFGKSQDVLKEVVEEHFKKDFFGDKKTEDPFLEDSIEVSFSRSITRGYVYLKAYRRNKLEGTESSSIPIVILADHLVGLSSKLAGSIDEEQTVLGDTE